MCTLTYIPFENGAFALGMNRDESPLRPPALRLKLGPDFAHPVDPQGGGTWVGLNRHGLALALMNQHPRGWKGRKGPSSRGAIIPRLLGCHDMEEAAARAMKIDPRRFAPFLLFAASRQSAVWTLRWDGENLESRETPRQALLLSSSALRQAEAEGLRRRRFEREMAAAPPQDLDAAARFQERFHRSHLPERGPLSVCLHREDAHSVSYSSVRMGLKDARLRYYQGPPCESDVAQEAGLNL